MNDILPVRQLPENKVGKDYVIGDLHGCYELLERLLDAVNFDMKTDRLFAVGDLIDRGPDSLRCLGLLSEPWFFSVLGNHELMLLDFFEPYLRKGVLQSFAHLDNNGFLDYGGAWVENYFVAETKSMSEEFDRCLAYVRDLPQIVVVGEGDNRFNIIHAELLRPDHKFAKREVWLDSEIDGWLDQKILRHDVEERLLWGRTLLTVRAAKLKNANVQPGLSMTFCGHTLDHKIRRVLSHVCIDTGAFMSADETAHPYGLTLFDVQSSSFYQASYTCNDVVKENFPRS
ncbi:MAG: metallophosphoesterase [Methylomonas sp.]|jgi:serine/threonine protein phosphatase 1